MGIVNMLRNQFNEKEVKRYGKIADRIMALEPKMQQLSDKQLAGKTDEFRRKLENGDKLEDLMIEAFAVVREVSSRVIGLKHYRVQLIAGIVLFNGNVAEMKTGEGKTLVATCPTYLSALTGKGVHVVTTNDYLANRDMEWMGKIYEFLGLTVGCIRSQDNFEQRKHAYGCDITYGTASEFGFDYLKDNMAISKQMCVQREFNYAIIDEIDSILIDEARTPLIISGPDAESDKLYEKADKLIRTLKAGEDYVVDEKEKTAVLTDEGLPKAEKHFGVDNLSDLEHIDINHYILQSLYAHALMKVDCDYIVQDDEILIIDSNTGRIAVGRRFSNGLHQAIETKEGVRVKNELKTYATITLQNFFKMYGKLSGMTGTAATEETEFRQVYNLGIIRIPTNKPIKRVDHPDAVYKTAAVRDRELLQEIIERHKTRQPILVGTSSIEESEKLSEKLKKNGVKHNVLNAKHHEKEALIIAQAGRLGAVTVSTSMAGRGTDILLGGNPDFMAKSDMKSRGYTHEQVLSAVNHTPTDDPEILELRDEYSKLLEYRAEQCVREKEEVIKTGGLCVLGGGRQTLRRIDNQMIGRSGRQGDPGESKFFVCFEDDLLRLFAENMKGVIDRLVQDENSVIQHRALSNAIESAQRKVEGINYSARKSTLNFDDVVSAQREVIYKERRMIMESTDIREEVVKIIRGIAEETVVYSDMIDYQYDYQDLYKKLAALGINKDSLNYEFDENDVMDVKRFTEVLAETMLKIYEDKEAMYGEAIVRDVERRALLRIVDINWIDHLSAMEFLKTGVSLHGMMAQDPFMAYRDEGSKMFMDMMHGIQEELVKFILSFEVKPA